VNVTFYIEPVIFRENPFLLKPWIEWISRIIIQQNSIGINFSFVSNIFLCEDLKRNLNGTPCSLKIINQRDILRQFSYNRLQYAKDLFCESITEGKNHKLSEEIVDFLEFFSTDIVISFTQNIYIEEHSKNIKSLFMELGPLPRSNGTLSFFFDSMGHQSNSILNNFARNIKSLPLTFENQRDVLEIWSNYINDVRVSHEVSEKIRIWIDDIRGDKRIVAFALQPPDWLTYEGAWQPFPLDTLLMNWLEELPEDWLAIPLYHPAYELPEDVEASIKKDFPQVRFAPRSLSKGFGEFFLPYIDAVATISSSLGLQAALMGLRLVSYGNSNLRSLGAPSLSQLADIQAFSQQEIASLLAFLSNKYCHKLTDCLNKQNYFYDRILDMDLKDIKNSYLNLSDWSPNNLSYLLSHH
jgi:hypothetical protein